MYTSYILGKYSWNTQEILKYRIRRKRVYVKLIHNLIQHYKVSQSEL